MELIKIALIAVVGALLFIYLKSNSSDLAGLVVVATGILILLLTVDYVIETVTFFKKIGQNTGIDSSFLKIIVKIVAVSYLADFSSSLCADLGSTNLGEKVSFAGRIIIFVLSFPIFINLFNVITSFIK